ncbi:hypothetical protein [Dysgonomonas sp. 521]|uniref:hypothetical protein n=1 Tax=Dysgonomonas sp. 521 TaxID=2302932 RepID=UPI0013D1B361|nr:hypothetical protein [Dysgonomonas sp. 521]
MCSFLSARNHRLLALLLAKAPKVSKKALRPASLYDPPTVCQLNEVIMDSSFYRLGNLA